MRERTPPPRAPGRPRPRLAGLATSLAAFSLTGCDVPTELPALETRWVIPSEDTRFGVAQLLPNAVSVTTTGNAFVVDFSPVTFSETLGSLCAACIALDGQTVPKPPFLGSLTSEVPLPSRVVAISVVSGDVVIDLDNELNFDPLRPAAGAFGEITVMVSDDADGDVLGTLTIDGAATPLPPGGTLTRTLTLAAATVEGSLAVTVMLDSPLGDAVTLDISDRVSATVTPTAIVVSSATIDAAATEVSFDPQTIDTDLDPDMTDRIQAGSFVLDVTNPFGVTADFDLSIDGPSIDPIVKSETIGTAPTSTIVIPFTVAEIRSFLDQESVTLTGGAVVDPSAAPFPVMPGEELVLSGKLDLILRIGG